MKLHLNDPSEWNEKDLFEKIAEIKNKIQFKLEIQDKTPLPDDHYKICLDLFMYFARQVEPEFEIDESLKPIIRDLLDWLTNNPLGRFDPMKGLMIVGNVGTGKTTLLKIIKEAGRVMRFPIDEFRETSFRITTMTEIATFFLKNGQPGLVREYAQRECQAIDDVGNELKESQHMGNRANPFSIIVELKYNNRGSLLHLLHFTTNLNSQEMIERYGERTFDRLREMVNIIKLEGCSRRKGGNNVSSDPLSQWENMKRGY